MSRTTWRCSARRRVALVTEREQPAGKARTRSLISLAARHRRPADASARRASSTAVRGATSATTGRSRRAFSPLVARHRPTGTRASSPGSARSGIWAHVGGKPFAALGPFGHSPSLHLAADGSGLLTWRRGSLILARVRSASGHWGPIERVARIGRYSEAPPASIAGADGRFARRADRDHALDERRALGARRCTRATARCARDSGSSAGRSSPTRRHDLRHRQSLQTLRRR